MSARREPVAPPIPWEMLRDAYALHFGSLIDVHEEREDGSEQPPVADDDEDLIPDVETMALDCEAYMAADVSHYVLRFDARTGEAWRVTFATFGAADLLGGFEVFLESAVPFSRFELLVEMVCEHGPLSPGMVVPMEIWGTPFRAMLVAPPGAGSISVGEENGAERFALRLVPLTSAEQKLAADSVDRLVASLRAAGALGPCDPFRSCALLPHSTERFWAILRPSFLAERERSRERMQEHLEKMVALQAPESFIERARRSLLEGKALERHLDSRPPDPSTPAERDAARYHSSLEVQKEIYRPVMELFDRGAVPGAIRALSAAVVAVTLETHPIARRLSDLAQGRQTAFKFNPDELMARVVSMLRELVPDSDPARLLHAGRHGLAAAVDGAAAADGFVAPHLVWWFVVGAMFVALEDRSTEESTAAAVAAQAGLETANLALVREDDRGPLELLQAAGQTIVLRMVKTWFEVLGIDVGAPSPEKASAKQGASRRKTERKPRNYH